MLSARMPARWWAGLAGRLARLGAATAGVAACVLGLRSFHLGVAMLAGLIVYATLLRILHAVPPEDRRLLSRMLTSMPGAASLGRLWLRVAG
jgi:hypothetical protein